METTGCETLCSIPSAEDKCKNNSRICKKPHASDEENYSKDAN
jgi:hypothetical protein